MNRLRLVSLLRVLGSFAALLITAGSAASQEAAVDAARAGVAALGQAWNGEVNAATAALYAELHRNIGSEGIRRVADVRYGPHERHVLDLYVPEHGFSEPGPVLIYFHGGGLVRGDKGVAGTDGLIYGNVGRFMARSGGIGIIANYRLVPDAAFPSGAEDIRLLVAWLRENIAEHGGDPGNVFLMGNSAGATHVATYLFHAPSQLDEGPGVRGAILSSGAFDAGGGSAEVAYYGEDAAERARRSPLGLVDTYGGELVPLFLWTGEHDPESIVSGVRAMHAKLCGKYPACPTYQHFPGHNHVSHVMSIDTADREITNALIRFYHSVVD